ncbi:MAG: aminotransferase class I/II-fold pyridoxal phosphate-dependent enzyme [Treponema sp.]|jgi:cystathionine beta-lyase|nr:aminotransferase class I/II-fold pyridoxal phosphate-dependent enzyme [Treponema sp.]
MYDFDGLSAAGVRRGAGALKWTNVAEDVIPLWVADMDFPCLPELREALEKRAAHPFYGYTRHNPSSNEAIAQWYRRYGAGIEPEETLIGPGTVLSLGMGVREFSAAGDGVLVMTPVYTPFYEIIRGNGRIVVELPLHPDKEAAFAFDAAEIEACLSGAAADGIRVSVAILCSPHNPGGRVWSGKELAAFFEIAARHNLMILADEIHMDFAFQKEFVSAASFDEYRDRIIVVSGANKTFNLGGLHISHFVIRDGVLRARIERVLRRETHHESDCFAELAVETVYRRGAPWLAELKARVRANLEKTARFLGAEIDGVHAPVPQGTYLLWADMKGLIGRKGCKGDADLVRRIEAEAKVKLTAGSLYGAGGAGFVRINAASPAPLLDEALGRIRDWARA